MMAQNKKFIEWNIRSRHSPLGTSMSSGGPLWVRTFQFSGRNVSDHQINPIEAYVRAPKTGEVFQLGGVLEGNVIPLAETGLVPGGSFSLSYQFPARSPQELTGLPATDFLQKYPELHFHFSSENYDYNEEYSSADLKRYLSEIETEMREMQNKAKRDGVIRRS